MPPHWILIWHIRILKQELSAGLRHDNYTYTKNMFMKKILTLLALGFAAKYFLDSKEGQELKTKAKSWLSDAEKKLTGTLSNAESQVEEVTPNAN